MLLLRMLGALVLMFALRADSGSSCPPELNPLTLDVPMVIGRHGEDVLVNCTSTEEDHDGIYWSIRNTTGTYDTGIEDEKRFNLLLLSLSDWNLTAECKIKLRSSYECSENLEIIVYENPVVNTFPVRHESSVVEGSLYELQCDVLEAAPVQNITVRWYKDNNIIQTDFFYNHTEKAPKEVSSTLIVNMSRGDSGAQLRCEAQLDFGLNHPPLPVDFAEQRLVPVHYAPELKNQAVDFIHVNEGDDVSLSCGAEGRPPPVFQWACDGVNVSQDTDNVNVTFVSANTTCSCNATNYVGSIVKQIHISVTKTTRMAAPAAMTTPKASTPRDCPLTLTPAEIMVRFGDPVSINCSTSAADAAGMGWEAVIGGKALETSRSVTWMVEKVEDWTLKPECYINLEDGRQCTVIPTITLYKTPDTVSVSTVNPGPMVQGTEYLLTCEVINVAPVQGLMVKWYRGNQLVHTEKDYLITEVPFNKSYSLKVTPHRDDNGAIYTCDTELRLGPKGPDVNLTTTSPPFTAVVLYEPVIQACPGRYSGLEHEFSLDMVPCGADGNPPPSVQWSYQGESINASKHLTKTHSGKHTAEFVNSLGRITTSVDITIEYPPVACHKHCEVKEDSELPTRCKPEGVPEPIVTLFKDSKAMAAAQRWTKHHSGSYSLRATNTHGTANCEIYLDVLYAPVFDEGNHSRELTPGENVTLVCRAEGNPPPQVRWSYPSAANVKVTSGGRHETIIITGATSTNTGVYNCAATNKVGRVTRSVTLMMKDKTSGISLVLICGLLILLALVILILIIFHKQRKSHGQYSFVQGSAKDGSDIPMTPQSGSMQA
ncbi:intercellular adhesion molecule 1 [Pempheris klunzingeri]|uniref:intercellular adhesion molecule 1 n=1 Tax=Pempheris klunzingeri TaxID=3127111 RepID=UPI0039808C91